MTLTEQWKKGELESGYYYIVVKQVEFPNRIDFYNSSATVWSYHSNDCVEEVLAPVPSYEEWQELIDKKNWCNARAKNLLEKNQQLHTWCEEFNALDVAKENQQLKELLKECRGLLEEVELCRYDVADVDQEDWFRISTEQAGIAKKMKIKITNAIGEKK